MPSSPEAHIQAWDNVNYGRTFIEYHEAAGRDELEEEAPAEEAGSDEDDESPGRDDPEGRPGD
ncbi:MAG TPA: hypothetical protein VFX42_05705 [Gemmatimonadales bacterium]|nr:hypothetical protein [Gemmatimonadales bacterium]